MEHVLNNPAWNALISGNEKLSKGNDRVKYFDIEVSPFAAFRENTTENFTLLYEMLPDGRPALLVSPDELNIPEQWSVLNFVKGLQMVYEDSETLPPVTISATSLSARHVPQMVALTKLTQPGPFGDRTIEFGHYQGVLENHDLAAMAGQRMHAFNYAEISAVCTHPDHLGKGYARQLMINQITRIKTAGEIPFLHVRDDNERAIKLYESLGFKTRTRVYFYAIKKANESLGQ